MRLINTQPFIEDMEDLEGKTIAKATEFSPYAEPLAILTFTDGSWTAIQATVGPYDNEPRLYTTQNIEPWQEHLAGLITEETYNQWQEKVKADRAADLAQSEKAEYLRLKAKFENKGGN
jgi:hypothetical protein